VVIREESDELECEMAQVENLRVSMSCVHHLKKNGT